MFDPAILGTLLFWICPLLTLGLIAVPWLLAADGFEKIKLKWAHSVPLILASLSVWMLSAHHRPDQRVQWDESVVFATSLSMHFGHSAYMPTMTAPSAQGPVPLQFALDKRPPMFPFLGSLVHSLLGASERNLIRLNLLLLFFFLFALALLLMRQAGPGAAIAATLLVLGNPIVIWVSTSGGIDLLAAISVFGFLYAVSFFWRNPSLRALSAIMLAGLFSSYTRYEVVGIVLPSVLLCVLLCLIKMRRAAGRVHFSALFLALGAFLLLLVPLFALLSVARMSFTESAAAPLISYQNLRQNFLPFIKGFFEPGYARAFQAWINDFGLLVFLVAIFRGWEKMAVRFVAGAVLFQLALALSFFSGDPLGPLSARLYLLPALALSLAPLLLLRGNVKQKNAKAWGLAVLCFLTIQFTAQEYYFDTEVFPPSVENNVKLSLNKYFDSTDTDPIGRLTISNLHFVLVSHGYPSVSPSFFLERKQLFGQKLAYGEIKEIVWLRTPADDPMKLAAAEERALESQENWQELKQNREYPWLRFLSWKP